MFDIADLLPFLQSALSKKDGEKGQNPLGNLDLSSLISGGGFGGGQGGQGGLLGNLFKGGNSSGGLEGLFGKSGSGLAKGSTSGLFSNGLGMAKGATSGLFSKGALGLAKGSTGGLFSGGMSGAGGMGAAGIYSALGNIGGNMVAKNNTNKYGIIDKTSAKGAGALKGAGTGAAIGSIIPSVGTLIGAGVGALVGGLTGKGNEDEVKEAYRTPAIEILDGNIKKDTNESQFKNLLYDFDGVETTGYAKNGGYVNKAEGGDVDPTKGKKSKPRNLTSAEKNALNKSFTSQGNAGTFSNTAGTYDPHGDGGIFSTIDSVQPNYPDLDLGKYKDVGYFDVQTSQDGRYTVNNTKKNPANAALYKQQLEQISRLNPKANIARNNSSGFNPLINLGLGGNAVPDYKVEDQEVIYAPEDNPPMTDGNGTAEKIGPNMFKFKGDKHSDSSGGIGVQGGNTPFMGSAGDVKQTGFVFSKKLKTDATKYLNGL